VPDPRVSHAANACAVTFEWTIWRLVIFAPHRSRSHPLKPFRSHSSADSRASGCRSYRGQL
jgi:hypothetical protein